MSTWARRPLKSWFVLGKIFLMASTFPLVLVQILLKKEKQVLIPIKMWSKSTTYT